ncbi:M48 family metallopeptidase [Parachitinimonas caeni]|uniref:M48 family metallopeptidase n=1 Tax=Parachitinimonas caeni TaxID=3031301 RepID=A0ABT7DRD5_9NEIS|nr:M48 family metallopeptidase [Parachitinimonas caeni]MDK2122627.1 M48 family metallopeptidase [Parachitinimonas caeni]
MYLRLENFDVSVAEHQQMLQKHPVRFRLQVAAFSLLGLLIFGGVLGTGVLVLLLVVVLVLSLKGLLVLLKFLNVVWVLLIPVWGFLRIGWRTVASPSPMPNGRWIKPHEAPALFADLARMRQQLRGPKIHGVLLTEDFNAFAISRPLGGFWFLGLRRHYIGLGVPLIQTLSEAEAMAVVAHEYGHLSGHPSRFDSAIYRLRIFLLHMLDEASRWKDWPSRLLVRVLNWYVPRFDVLVFALCRNAEYGADRASARLVSPHTAADALMRFSIAAAYLQEDFWQKIYARVEQEPQPEARPWFELPALIRCDPDREISMRILRRRLAQETNYFDTHPALSDRLQAMGLDPDQILIEGRSIAPVADQTAAEAWFGDHLSEVLAEFDQRWRDGIATQWQERHQELTQSKARRMELEANSSRSVAEEWELLLFRIQADELEDDDAAVDAFFGLHPDHAPAVLAYGRRWLGEQPQKAITAIHRAMLLQPDLAPAAAALLASYWEDRDTHRHALYKLMASHLGGEPHV